MTAEKRLVRVTAANRTVLGAVSRPRRRTGSSPRPQGEGSGVRAYVTGFGDFFPPEAFGGARRKNGAGDGIELTCRAKNP